MTPKWTRLINRLVPTGLLPRRRNTEMVLRGLYQKYRGKSLEMDFSEFGIGEAEIKQIFDEIDEKFGAAIFCGDLGRMDAATNGAFTLMVSRTLGLKK